MRTFLRMRCLVSSMRMGEETKKLLGGRMEAIYMTAFVKLYAKRIDVVYM